MTRKKTILTILLVVLVAILIWFFFFRKKDQAYVVETEKPTAGYISESVTATGTIQPVDTVSVGTQVSGTIATLFADFNSTVKKGQLLAELDKTLFEATVEQTKASLAQAQSNLSYQESNFNRQKQLYATGSISKADYEVALNSYNTARANVNNIRAQLKSAQKNLSFTEIYSPMDGVVLNRNVSIGQTVAASFNTPTLFVIAKDITKMQVQADVDEADIGNVKESQRTTFTVDAYLDDVFDGTVKEIRLQPTTTSNVVTYTTIIDAPNDNKKLMPGMTANIIIYTKEVQNALLISAEALKFTPTQDMAQQFELKPLPSENRNNTTQDSVEFTSIWVEVDNELVQKKIKTGLNNNTQVEVLEGLTPNDQVVTKVEQASAAETEAASSPFMPKRPSRKKK